MINFAENLNKMIVAGLGGEMEAPRTEVAVGHRIQYMNASGPVASFETNIVAPLRKLLVNMLPIQAGSGDPSPDNIRPITGFDMVTVTRAGKNLFDKSQTFERGNITENGSIGTGAGYTHTDYIRVKGNTTYTTSGNIINGAGRNAIAFYDANRNFLYRHLPPVPGGTTFTTPAECEYIRMNLYLQTEETLATIQLEEGDTASDFEPYDGSSVTIQLGQTVYGGTLDVTTGKLTVDKAAVTFDGSQPVSQYAFTSSETRNRIAWTPYQTLGAVGSMYFLSDTLTAENTYDNFPGIWKVATSGPTVARMFIGVPLSITSRDDWKTYVTDHPITIVYELADPVAIDLDPQQITTLIGDNNIWSDAGDVDVTYIYYEETEGY